MTAKTPTTFGNHAATFIVIQLAQLALLVAALYTGNEYLVRTYCTLTWMGFVVFLGCCILDPLDWIHAITTPQWWKTGKIFYYMGMILTLFAIGWIWTAVAAILAFFTLHTAIQIQKDHQGV